MGGLDNPLICDELSSTIYGLGFVGLLFVVGFAFQVRRAFKRPRSGDGGDPSRPAASLCEAGLDDGNPDADSMIARYLAKRSESGPEPAVSRPTASFGRRVRT